MQAVKQPGEAGRRGERSDLYVGVAPASEGLTITLRSKVAPYYGAAIEAQVREVLGRYGVEAALIEIDDGGALPFVIGARIESALQRTGLGSQPPGAVGRREPSERQRLRRSRLYLPGNQPKYMANAALHGPDGVILDLEDSVHPADKDAARVLVREALRALSFSPTERMVRINQLPLGLIDLEELVQAEPDLILIPKVEAAAEVQLVERLLRKLSPTRPIWLMPIIESALGIENAFAIASASERVVALTIGLEDYTADLGVAKTREGGESLWARQRLLNAARAAGVQAIDSVYGDVGDAEGLHAWACASRALGFSGMGCVHPRQIETIHRAFAPSVAEVERAQKIVAAFERAQAAGLGVVSLGSKMIDAPVVKRALELLRQVEQRKGSGQ